MMTQDPQTVKVAVLDLYNGAPNQGMRCIKELLHDVNETFYKIPVAFDVYATRDKAEVPDLDYDIYISSGGPGSPFDGAGSLWEERYFHWLDSVWQQNEKNAFGKKYVFAICHSFQLLTRFFAFAEVTERHSPSFGIMPVHKTPAGKGELIFSDLPNPFFAADFRDFQVIQPDKTRLFELGAEVIALEKIRPHIDLERAIMGVRLSPEIVGVQFHPEADPASMLYHINKPERKEQIISEKGIEKYNIVLHRLEDSNYLMPTREAVLPNFLSNAIENLRPEIVFNFAE